MTVSPEEVTKSEYLLPDFSNQLDSGPPEASLEHVQNVLSI